MLRAQLTMGVLIVAVLASSAALGNNKWTGNGPTNLWNDAGNWQKGIPCDVYMKSLWRHFMDVWTRHRGRKTFALMDEALCAVLFNVMGYLHEWLKARGYGGEADEQARAGSGAAEGGE